MIYVTKSCPHCGRKYEIMQPSGKKSWGSPVRMCPRCGKQFVDTSFLEMALVGFDGKVSLLSGTSILLLLFSSGVLGLTINMTTVALSLNEPLDWITILMYILGGIFLLGAIASIVTDIKTHEETLKELQIEKENSEKRCEDVEYLKLLMSHKIKVPQSVYEKADKIEYEKIKAREKAEDEKRKEGLERAEKARKMWEDFVAQGEELKKIYPEFDFEEVRTNVEVSKLLMDHTLKEAYEIVYKGAENTEPDEPIFCRKCGAKIPSDSVFCIKCGEKVIK